MNELKRERGAKQKPNDSTVSIRVRNDDGSVRIIYAEDYKGKKTQSEKEQQSVDKATTLCIE